MSVIDKLRKNSTVKLTDVLVDSEIYNQKDVVVTAVPALNVALSGDLHSGFTAGLTVIAGPSKHFKTGLGLIQVKAYLDKYKDAVCLFYDSEFGAPQSYFKAAGIDPSRVLHTPVTDIEQLKFDIMNQLNELKRGDRVIILIDSIGNLASKKEVEDALEQKGAADMTRAKQLKSLFRMVTPHLTIKNVPCVAINHIYMEQGMYPKAIVSGGTGIYLSADTIIIVGRQQEKDGTEIVGYNFILNIEKSRYVREKSKVPVSVTYDEGVSKWSGLLDLGQEAGLVVKPSNGWYSRVQTSGEVEDKKWRKDDTNCEEFMGPLLADVRFQKWVRDNFQLGVGESNPSAEEIVDD